ncbi:Phage/plasmid primase [Phytophthora nicotianae]|uniref:Phage/plasmid primase n=1 Tax=Phytophthora nicotianae TaxID=4792 RepID=A0A0W8CPT6_PHYNI|nr:Phage/plasmid primase [Phytophthora nicotianae]
MTGDDADASDLQEKMRRLNVALLDAVDRLQLDESGEMAPEAQLLLSLTQRERLKKQVQQSKTMLALIEQLTEMDRLLGDVDEAIDHQCFVAAAEGVAEVERLVNELAKSENGQGGNVDDKKIIRVVKLQLLSKKNRLLNQLTRYFSCTAVWKDNALRVTADLPEMELEGTKLSMEERRTDFWKACEVLDILAPKMKDIVKAITLHLIKPMLQIPHGTLKQIRDESGVTLKVVVQNPKDASDDSEVAEVQSKCANVVSVLQFVHTELFAGNAELMHQLGDFMWKIPGNLEAQLMNLLQDKIPQDSAALEEYRGVLATAVRAQHRRVITECHKVGEYSETLFISPAQAAKYVPSIGRLSKLTAILMDPLTTVREKFDSGSLDSFSSNELAVLVRSLFRESPEKKAFLQELLAA